MPYSKNYKQAAQSTWFSLLICVMLAQYTPALMAQSAAIKVLGWTKSDSEHKAVGVLTNRLAQQNISWQEIVLPGVANGSDLKARALNGTAPDLAEIKGPMIGAWSTLGLLTEFKPAKLVAVDTVNGRWDRQMFPAVAELVRPGGKLVAVPLGIHRMNTLFFNRTVFNQVGLPVPENWDQFADVANRLQKEGINPLAQSSEPWQVAALFESLLLSESAPDLYRRIFIAKDPAAFSDTRFTTALLRLKILKKFMAKPIHEQSWVDVTKSVIKGYSAMMIMGDFAKGELNAWGNTTDVNFGCVAVPGTAGYHIYDIETVVLFKNPAMTSELSEKTARILMSSTVQADYNMLKGSVPVLKNADQLKMDSCARDSWKVFAQGSSAQVPSFVRDMTTDSVFKNAFVAEITRYFLDDTIPVAAEQRRMTLLAQSMNNAGS